MMVRTLSKPAALVIAEVFLIHILALEGQRIYRKRFEAGKRAGLETKIRVSLRTDRPAGMGKLRKIGQRGRFPMSDPGLRETM